MFNDTLKWTCFRSLLLRRKFELLLQILENIYKAVRILVFMGLNLNACVLLSYCVPYVTPWLILSFFLYHLTDFTRKWPSRGKQMSSLERTKKLGVDPPPSPPHPPLIDSFFRNDRSCLPCGNNIFWYACVLQKTFSYIKLVLLE